MKPILLKNGLTFDIGSGSTIPVELLIHHGKIKKVSHCIECEYDSINIIDTRQGYILPGMIDCHTHLGIIEEATGKIGVDNNETSDPVTPHLRGIDAINPFDIAFSDAVRSGVTCVMSGPGSNNAVGGLSTVIKTHGSIIDHMIVRDPVGLKIAFGENPMTTYGKDGKSPVTRMGIASLIRELFMRTQDYMNLKDNGQLKERDIRLEAVIPVLKGDISLRAHAHRADDIVTAIRIANEFNIQKLVIEHGTEANLVKKYLKERNVPVAFGPMLTPRIKMELKRRHYASVAELVEAGVKVALITDHPYNSIDQLKTVAAIAVSEGLSFNDAIKCLTLNPSEILECDDTIGQLKEGYDADCAVFDGMPLDYNSKAVMTIINGEIVYDRKREEN
jgi:imidazolonepropionase-like amidohydrolase